VYDELCGFSWLRAGALEGNTVMNIKDCVSDSQAEEGLRSR
jgi:hypothetical protein